MTTIERRLAALEQVTTGDRITVVIWKLGEPGKLDAEVLTITGDAGEVWSRAPGESLRELMDRASRGARRNHSGFAQLIARP